MDQKYNMVIDLSSMYLLANIDKEEIQTQKRIVKIRNRKLIKKTS